MAFDVNARWLLRGWALFVLLHLAVPNALAQNCSGPDCAVAPVWYRVTLNGKPAGDALGVQVPGRNGIWLESPFVDGDAVLSRFVRLVRLVDGDSFASLDAMQEVTYTVLATEAQLHIRVPARYLREQQLQPEAATQMPPVARGSGLRLAYDAFASQRFSGHEDPALSLYLDGTWFRPGGSLRNTALLSHGPSRKAVRLDTAWEKEWFAQGVFAILGDHIGPVDAFGRQPRRGGLSIRRAFEFEPQKIRYPLPLLAGSTDLPATVDLYVDNVRRESYDVDSGPFTVARPPVLSGAGTAQLVVTNILGEQVTYEQSFFVVPQLLNPGVWDFELSAGAQRESYAINSFDYGDFSATANWRYGLSSQWTTEGSLVAGPQLGVLELGSAGIPLAAVPLRTDGGLGAYRLTTGESGVLARVGLSWQLRRWFADIAHRQAIPARKVDGESELPYRRRQVARFGVRVGAQALSLSYIRRDRPQQDNFRQWILRTSWRPRPGRWGQLTAEVFRTEFASSEPRDTGVRVNWIWSPKPRQQSLAYVEDEARGGWQYQWMRKGDLGPQASLQGRYEGTGQAYFSGDYDVQTSLVGARARAVSASTGEQLSLGVRGTVGWLGGRMLLGRDPGQAFALVDMHGLPGVTVYRDNQPVARTSESGVALIPGLRPYEDNRIHVNPVDIPLDWRLPQAQMTVRPGRNTGVVVDFDTAPERSATLRLFLRPGVPVPAGASITNTAGETMGYTGGEGRVYVSGLDVGTTLLQVEWPQGACSYALNWPQSDDVRDMLRVSLGDMLCR